MKPIQADRPADKMLRARCLLLAREPWYGHAAAAMGWVEDPHCPTMKVNINRQGRPVCYFGTSFVEQLSIYEIATVIQHEIEHIVRGHCRRLPGSDPSLANIACDMVINGCKSKPNIGVVNLDTKQREIPFRDTIAWLPEDWETDMTAEQCYQRLLQQGFTNPRGLQLLDDHDGWYSETESEDLSSHAAQVIIDATKQTGAAAPQRLQRVIEDLTKSKISWASYLRRFIRRASGRSLRGRMTWNRRSRRIDEFGMPGRQSIKQCRLAVIIDVSGSISQPVLAKFFGELEALIELAEMSVLFWDTELCHFDRDYQRQGWKNIDLKGGGGTDMCSAVAWLLEHNEAGAGIILLTDGYCHWPERLQVPMLVVCSSRPGEITEPQHHQIIYL